MDRAGEAKDRTVEGTKHAGPARAVRDKTAETAEGAMDRAGEAKDRTVEGTKHAGEKVAEMTKEGASKVVETAQAIGEKAKQAAQGAWGATKEAAQGVKDTVAGGDVDADAAMKEQDRIAQEEKKRQAREKGAGLP
jgi:phosphopentomutase